MEPKIVGNVYLHVGNSGATIAVVDSGYGPMLQIKTSSFGNLNQTTEILTTRAGLVALRDMLDDALRLDGHFFSAEYVHAAQPEGKAMGRIGGLLAKAAADAQQANPSPKLARKVDVKYDPRIDGQPAEHGEGEIPVPQCACCPPASK
jgi:hypothetical protein